MHPHGSVHDGRGGAGNIAPADPLQNLSRRDSEDYASTRRRYSTGIGGAGNLVSFAGHAAASTTESALDKARRLSIGRGGIGNMVLDRKQSVDADWMRRPSVFERFRGSVSSDCRSSDASGHEG